MKKPYEEFFTIYFKHGFESLVPLADFIEKKLKVDVGIGGDFLNFYTEDPDLANRIIRSVQRWGVVNKHVQISEVAPFLNGSGSGK